MDFSTKDANMTEKQAKQKIKKAGGNWKEFIKWMFGQTVGVNDDGSINYYDCDVNIFISYLHNN